VYSSTYTQTQCNEKDVGGHSICAKVANTLALHHKNMLSGKKCVKTSISLRPYSPRTIFEHSVDQTLAQSVDQMLLCDNSTTHGSGQSKDWVDERDISSSLYYKQQVVPLLLHSSSSTTSFILFPLVKLNLHWLAPSITKVHTLWPSTVVSSGSNGNSTVLRKNASNWRPSVLHLKSWHP